MSERATTHEASTMQDRVRAELGEKGPLLVESLVAEEASMRQEQDEINAIRSRYAQERREIREARDEYDQLRVDELHRRFEEAGVTYCTGCRSMQTAEDVETTLAVGRRGWYEHDCKGARSGVSYVKELHELCGDCREHPDTESKYLPTAGSRKSFELFAAEISEAGTVSYYTYGGVREQIDIDSIRRRFSFTDVEQQFRTFGELPSKIKPWGEDIPPALHGLVVTHYEHSGGAAIAYTDRLKNTPAANEMLQELRAPFKQ